MTYKINNINLLTAYKIAVKKCMGTFDFPARLDPTERDWHDEDGVEAFVEKRDIHFKQRTISLDCTSVCDSVYEFQNLMTDFKEAVYNKCTLSTPYGEFEVLLKKEVRLKQIGSYTTGKFDFQLVFNELKADFGEPPVANCPSSGFAIDNLSLEKEFGIIIEECHGQFDFPKMKTDKLTRYLRESDKVNTRAYRDITLKCSMFANNLESFTAQMNALHALLAAEGFRQLQMPLVLSIPKVYCKNGFRLTNLKRQNDLVVGQFTLVLRETNPQDRDAIKIFVLTDNKGVPILTPSGQYIYISTGTKPENVYLFLESENQEDTYLYTQVENEEDTYLFG